MQMLTNLKNELSCLKKEYDSIYIQGYYVYVAWNKPVDGKKSAIIKSDRPEDLVHKYAQYSKMEELKYVALGVDYEKPDCIYPCSMDLLYKKAC